MMFFEMNIISDKEINCSLTRPACSVLVESLCYKICGTTIDAKDKFHSSVYYIALNPICVAPRVSKNLEKLWKIELEAKIIRGVI